MCIWVRLSSVANSWVPEILTDLFDSVSNRSYMWPILENTEEYIKTLPEDQRDKASIEEAIMKAARENVHTALENVSEFIEFISPDKREDFILELAQKNKGAVLAHAAHCMEYISPDKREDILTEAMRVFTGLALANADEVAEYLPKEKHEEFFAEAMRLDPNSALRSVDKYIDYIPKARREELVIQAMRADPNTALTIFPEFKGHIPRAKREELLIDAAQRATGETVLEHASKYMKYISDDDKRDAILENAARGDPRTALILASSYMKYVSDDDKRDAILEEAIKRDPKTALEHASRYMDYLSQEKREAFIKDAVKNDPKSALKNADEFIKYIPRSERAELLEDAAKATIAQLDNVGHLSKETLHYLSQETQDKLQEIARLQSESLRIGRTLNDLHDETDEVRFASIKDMSADELYNLMIFGREEVYTSTYLGVFDRFMDRLKEGGHDSVFDVADPAYASSVAIFLEQASEFGKLDEALSIIPADKWENIKEQFASRIESGKLSSMAAFAEIIHKTTDPAVKQELEQFLLEKFENSPPGNLKDTYGVIISYYNELSGQEVIPLEDAERYDVETMNNLSKDDIYGDDGIHRQLVVFTEDDDGEASFENFKKRYEDNDQYTFEDKGGYIKITSKEGNLEIYANKPGESPDKIVDAIVGKKDADVADARFDAVIHRGHSYNLENTLPYITPNNKFVFLGSCGSFKNLDKVLELAPHAQVFSTKQTGTMAVNDPALYHINEAIRKGGPVDWSKEQEYMDRLGDARKEHYVLPHRNMGLALKRKLLELEGQPERMMADPNAPENIQQMSAQEICYRDDEVTFNGDLTLLDEAVQAGVVQVDPSLLIQNIDQHSRMNPEIQFSIGAG